MLAQKIKNIHLEFGRCRSFDAGGRVEERCGFFVVGEFFVFFTFGIEYLVVGGWWSCVLTVVIGIRVRYVGWGAFESASGTMLDTLSGTTFCLAVNVFRQSNN